MNDNDRYRNAPKVKIKLKKVWIGWHGAIHEAGTIMTVAKESRYFDSPGMGYPSLDIETECIEFEVKDSMEKYDRIKELKYLQNIIDNIEKSPVPIAEVAVDANVFLEIARCFINNCKPLKEEIKDGN